MTYLDGAMRPPVSVLDLDAILVPAKRAKKIEARHLRGLRGRISDPVWLSPMSASILHWLMSSTEMISATERLSVELVGACVPLRKFVLIAGGFTIRVRGEHFDQDWRAVQERLVGGDRELYGDLICEARRALGDRAVRFSVIEEGGLPYALSIPQDLFSSQEVVEFLTGHHLVGSFTQVRRLHAAILRRPEIGFAAALDYLRDARPELADRPFFGVGPAMTDPRLASLLEMRAA